MIPKKIVTAVFERDNYTCQYCFDQQPPEQHSLHCHHVIHKSQGGEDTLENLKTACWKCHGNHGEISKTDKEENMTNIWDDPNTRYVEFIHEDTGIIATVTATRAEPQNNVPKEMIIHAISIKGIKPEPNIKDLLTPKELEVMEDQIWDAMSEEHENQ